ncbi:MAG TPA: hypothetical protein PLO65_09030 [Caulobacter sp.]|nr:hypothetical protein [Caulobacter sp.]
MRFDSVAGAPDPTITVFQATRVVKETDGLRIESFWGAEGPTPNVVMTLTRNAELLTVKKSALFGDWYYIRCAQVGPLVYRPPQSPGGRRRP